MSHVSHRGGAALRPSAPVVATRALRLRVLADLRLQMLLAAALMSASVGVLFVPRASAEEIRPIVFPVDGENFYTDTYGACRSGCARRHLGVDLIGEKMLPLLAARDGVVSWLRHDDAKGNILTITDDEGWKYHYIHINNDTPGTDDGANRYEEAFAPGIEQGVRVTAGQVVAYLGDSGNAESTPPHLHFEIERPDGANINPTPSVAAAEENGFVAAPTVPAEKLGPYDDLATLVAAVGDELYGRSLSPTEQADLANRLIQTDLGTVLADVLADDEVDLGVQGVARLYQAYFLRSPDADGFAYWLDSRRSGVTLWDMSDQFEASEEFELRYGSLSDADFVDLVYRNVMEREPDQIGRDYWVERIQTELTRGDMMTYFSDSPEYRNRTRMLTEEVALSWLVDGAIPSEADVDAWSVARSGRSLAEAITERFAG